MAKKMWVQETSRDLLAVGSWVFYLLVIARALTGPFWPFFWQLAVAGICIMVFSALAYLVKSLRFDAYTGRASILLISTIMFYQDWIFSIFASVIFVFMIAASFFLRRDWKYIGLGLLFGAISIVLALLIGLHLFLETFI